MANKLNENLNTNLVGTINITLWNDSYKVNYLLPCSKLKITFYIKIKKLNYETLYDYIIYILKDYIIKEALIKGDN